jgi:hypothetical protein
MSYCKVPDQRKCDASWTTTSTTRRPTVLASKRKCHAMFQATRCVLAGLTLVATAFVVYTTFKRTAMIEMFNILKKNNAWVLQHVNSGFVLCFLTGSLTTVILITYAYEVVHDAWSDVHWSIDFYANETVSVDFRTYWMQYDFHDIVWIDVLSAIVGGSAAIFVRPKHPFLRWSVINEHGVLTFLARCAIALPLLLPYEVVRYSAIWVLLYPITFVLSSGVRGLFRWRGVQDACRAHWPICVCMAAPFLIFKYVLKPDNWVDASNWTDFNDLRPFSLYAYGLILVSALASRATQYAIGAKNSADEEDSA